MEEWSCVVFRDGDSASYAVGREFGMSLQNQNRNTWKCVKYACKMHVLSSYFSFQPKGRTL